MSGFDNETGGRWYETHTNGIVMMAGTHKSARDTGDRQSVHYSMELARFNARNLADSCEELEFSAWEARPVAVALLLYVRMEAAHEEWLASLPAEAAETDAPEEDRPTPTLQDCGSHQDSPVRPVSTDGSEKDAS